MDMRLYSKWLAGNLVIYGGDSMVGGKGKEFFVDPVNGLDTNTGLSWDSALASVAAAYLLCTDGANDKVIYLGGATGDTLAATLTWAKSYTHLIGACAPTMVAQRARIHNETVLALTPLINITGSGCIFKNIYIFQGVDEAVANINVQVTGGRNYFENVHFAGGGHASQAINGGASLKLDGAEENTFVDCTIGVDTIAAATGMMGLLLDTEARRNVFKHCNFTMSAGHIDAGFVEVVDGTGIDRYTIFDKCNFINTNFKNFVMASAFLLPAIAGNRNCTILLKDCMLHGVTTLDASDRGFLYGNMNAVTGADLSGVAKELIT